MAHDLNNTGALKRVCCRQYRMSHDQRHGCTVLRNTFDYYHAAHTCTSGCFGCSMSALPTPRMIAQITFCRTPPIQCPQHACGSRFTSFPVVVTIIFD